MPPPRSRRATAIRAALALGLGAAILGLLLAHLPIAQAFEWSLYDLRMRRTITPAGAPKRIAIVEIDEQTLRALEPIAGRWPWPRLFHGGLIDYLARGPAAVVAYDVGFFEPDGRSGFEVARRPLDRGRVGRRLRRGGAEGRQRRAAGRGQLRRVGGWQGRRRAPCAAHPRPAHRRRARGARHRPRPLRRAGPRRARPRPQPVRARHGRAAAPHHAVPALRGARRAVAGDGRLSGAGPRAARRGAAGRPTSSPRARPGCRCCRSRCRACRARAAPSARCTR